MGKKQYWKDGDEATLAGREGKVPQNTREEMPKEGITGESGHDMTARAQRGRNGHGIEKAISYPTRMGVKNARRYIGAPAMIHLIEC